MSFFQLGARARTPLAALGKLTVAALIGIALLVGYAAAFVLGHPEVTALAFALIALICAGIVSRGWQWAPLLGAILSGTLLASYIPLIGYIFTHPLSQTSSPLRSLCGWRSLGSSPAWARQSRTIVVATAVRHPGWWSASLGWPAGASAPS